MGKRLETIGVKNDPENRRQYRQLLFTAGKEAFNNISGVIIFHETLYQKDDEGVPLIKRVKDHGMRPSLIEAESRRLRVVVDDPCGRGSHIVTSRSQAHLARCQFYEKWNNEVEKNH